MTTSNHIALVEKAASRLAIPVTASLNGTTDTGWSDLAYTFPKAGAAAIELNTYFLPTNPSLSGPEVEARIFTVVRALRKGAQPRFSQDRPLFLGPGAHGAAHGAADCRGGAAGVVLVNRFYQPEIDAVRLTFPAQP